LRPRSGFPATAALNRLRGPAVDALDRPAFAQDQATIDKLSS